MTCLSDGWLEKLECCKLILYGNQCKVRDNFRCQNKLVKLIGAEITTVFVNLLRTNIANNSSIHGMGYS